MSRPAEHPDGRAFGIRVTDVVVAEQVRGDVGDLGALKQSIRSIGLILPIGVDRCGILIVGERRLRACRELGWPAIPARRLETVDDAAELLRLEATEPTCRKPMTLGELALLGRRVERLRLAPRTGGGPKRTSLREVGGAVGLSGQSYWRVRYVLRHCEDPNVPADVRKVAREAWDEMNRTGRPTPAQRKVGEAVHGLRRPLPPSQDPRVAHADEIQRAVLAMKGILGRLDVYLRNELDETVTSQAAVQWTKDLNAIIRPLYRLRRQLKERGENGQP